MRLQTDGTKITNFAHCDFRPMFECFEAEKARKKSMTTADKKEQKKAKDEAEAKYMYCTLDGRKEKVGNFRVEPPGLFRGRGEHPKKGALKVITFFLVLISSSSFSSFVYVLKTLRSISERVRPFLFPICLGSGKQSSTTTL